jgi:hypothetical protein
LFLRQKRNFEQKIEALEDTVITLDTEERSGRSYLKYAAILF